MKLEKYTCLGGRVNGKKIVGIKLNKQTIYPPFESDELYNSYTLGYIAHPTEGNSSTWYTVSVVKKDCFMDYELRTDWGDGTIDNATTHQYSYMKEYTITTNGFLSVESTDGTAYPVKVNHIRHDVIDGSNLFYDFKNVDVGYAFGDNLYLPETFYMTNMSYMFYNCDGVIGHYYGSDGVVDLSGFNTRKVTNMQGMFYDCNNLMRLDISNFDMTNVILTDDMFYNCTNLRELRLDNCNNETIFKIISSSNFPTNKIEFEGAVREIYIKKENATGLTTPENWIFIDCETGKEIIPGSINLYEPYEYKNKSEITEATTVVNNTHTDLSYMFYNCENLTTINGIDTWDTSNVTDMAYMFYWCWNLTTLDVSNFDTNNVTDMFCMFYNCNNLTSLDLSNFDTSNVADMRSMIYGCRKLTSLDLSNFDTSNVSTMQTMFGSCSNLTSLDLSNFNTSNVTSMGYMFEYCTSLTTLDLSSFNTSNVTHTRYMFYNCNKLTELNLSNFDMTNVTDTDSMFYNCNSLHTLRLDNCSNDTVNKIITSSSFPTGLINGETRKIYCKRANAAGLTAPDGWVFEYIN